MACTESGQCAAGRAAQVVGDTHAPQASRASPGQADSAPGHHSLPTVLWYLPAAQAPTCSRVQSRPQLPSMQLLLPSRLRPKVAPLSRQASQPQPLRATPLRTAAGQPVRGGLLCRPPRPEQLLQPSMRLAPLSSATGRSDPRSMRALTCQLLQGKGQAGGQSSRPRAGLLQTPLPHDRPQLRWGVCEGSCHPLRPWAQSQAAMHGSLAAVPQLHGAGSGRPRTCGLGLACHA